MQRPLLESLARAEQLARQDRDARVLVARGELVSEGAGRRLWRLRVPGALELKDSWARAKVRIDVVEAGGARRPHVLRSLRFTRHANELIIEAEEYGSGLDRRRSQFLVTFEHSSRSIPAIAEFEEAAVDTPSNAVAGLNYLTRDYAEFRSLLLNKISTFAEDWSDRSAADLGVMLSEVLAYLADDLSYYQDAVATEAYLTTARRRVSVDRHARLLDYWLDQGIGARAWVRFRAAQRVSVPPGTGLLAVVGGPGLVQAGSYQDAQLRKRSDLVFETIEGLVVYPGLERVTIIDRNTRQGYVIPPGTTEIEVRDVDLEPSSLPEDDDEDECDGEGDGGGLRLSDLEPGYVLVFETRSDFDLPAHPVRITETTPLGLGVVRLRWDPRDAPVRPIPVSRVLDGRLERELTALSGNITLADFGESQLWQLPPLVDPQKPYRPALPISIVPLPADDPDPSQPAALALEPASNTVRPAITLIESRDARALTGKSTIERPRRLESLDEVVGGGPIWNPVSDLLSCEAFSRSFMVESEGSVASLRFGDGTFGRAPGQGTEFWAIARVGDPGSSNVGVGVISTIVAPRPASDEDPKTSKFVAWTDARLQVDNPGVSFGGGRAESLTSAKRATTTLATRVEAALTLSDYRALASSVRGVADVSVTQRWTGSWLTTYVHVRSEDSEGDSAVLYDVERVLAQARVAGRDFVVRRQQWVSLEVGLKITLADGFGSEGVREAVRDAFLRPRAASGGAGFFEPSRWRFGETVWASAIATWAEGVHGVAKVEVNRLARVRDRTPLTVAAPTKLTMAPCELPQVRDEPGQPELGTLKLDIVDEVRRRSRQERPW